MGGGCVIPVEAVCDERSPNTKRTRWSSVRSDVICMEYGIDPGRPLDDVV